MNALTLDNDKLMAAVVDKIADEFMRTDEDLFHAVESRINKKIDALFISSVEPRIQSELDKALSDCFHREFQKTTAWGERDGEATSISKELEKLMSRFWAEKVDEKGNPNNYGKITRAEYTMAKVIGNDFKDNLERYMISSAAWLKDGLRDQMRGQIDVMLANLFHVKSAQDAAEGRYK